MEGDPVRRLVLLTVVAVFAVTAVAYAVANTMSYTAKVSYKGKPTPAKPANTSYTGTLHIDTTPPGQQPDIGPATTVFFAKGIQNNGKDFPSCTQAEIDGKADPLPAKCNKTIVGKGTAEAFAGTPGNPKSASVHECLDIKAMNGPGGKKLFLVATPVVCKDGTQPAVVFSNRVIPGTVIKASGVFKFAVRFDIPQSLQTQLGLAISLTDFSVTIDGKPRTFKIKGQSVKESYLQLTACKSSLPTKAETKFRDGSGAITTVTSTGKSNC
jgi:hypothetical protein